MTKALDKRSGLLIRAGTRVATEDEISGAAGRRKFFEIEKFDSKIVRDFLSKNGQSQGAYTIGVLVDKSALKTAKSGNFFANIKLSDLAKYDINKVKTHLEKKMEKTDLQTHMRSLKV